MINKFRELRYKVRALIYWAPVIWNWCDWDYQYSLTVLRHSLVALEKSIKNGHHDDAEDTARDVRIAIELLTRIEHHSLVQELKKEQEWNMLMDLLRKRMRGWWA